MLLLLECWRPWFAAPLAAGRGRPPPAPPERKGRSVAPHNKPFIMRRGMSGLVPGTVPAYARSGRQDSRQPLFFRVNIMRYVVPAPGSRGVALDATTFRLSAAGGRSAALVAPAVLFPTPRRRRAVAGVSGPAVRAVRVSCPRASFDTRPPRVHGATPL